MDDIDAVFNNLMDSSSDEENDDVEEEKKQLQEGTTDNLLETNKEDEKQLKAEEEAKLGTETHEEKEAEVRAQEAISAPVAGLVQSDLKKAEERSKINPVPEEQAQLASPRAPEEELLPMTEAEPTSGSTQEKKKGSEDIQDFFTNLVDSSDSDSDCDKEDEASKEYADLCQEQDRQLVSEAALSQDLQSFKESPALEKEKQHHQLEVPLRVEQEKESASNVTSSSVDQANHQAQAAAVSSLFKKKAAQLKNEQTMREQDPGARLPPSWADANSEAPLRTTQALTEQKQLEKQAADISQLLGQQNMTIDDIASVFPDLAAEFRNQGDSKLSAEERGRQEENLKNMLIFNKIHSIMHRIEVLEQQRYDEEEAKHQVVYDGPQQEYQFVYKPIDDEAEQAADQDVAKQGQEQKCKEQEEKVEQIEEDLGSSKQGEAHDEGQRVVEIEEEPQKGFVKEETLCEQEEEKESEVEELGSEEVDEARDYLELDQRRLQQEPAEVEMPRSRAREETNSQVEEHRSFEGEMEPPKNLEVAPALEDSREQVEEDPFDSLSQANSVPQVQTTPTPSFKFPKPNGITVQIEATPKKEPEHTSPAKVADASPAASPPPQRPPEPSAIHQAEAPILKYDLLSDSDFLGTDFEIQSDEMEECLPVDKVPILNCLQEGKSAEMFFEEQVHLLGEFEAKFGAVGDEDISPMSFDQRVSEESGSPLPQQSSSSESEEEKGSYLNFFRRIF